MISINASEVAGLVGKNPYKDPEEAIQNVINRNIHSTPSVEDQRTRDICNENKEARRLHSEMVANSRITKSSDQVETFKQSYNENIEKMKNIETQKIEIESERESENIKKELTQKFETIKKTEIEIIKTNSENVIENINQEFSQRIDGVKTRGQKVTLALEQRLAVETAETNKQGKIQKVETDTKTTIGLQQTAVVHNATIKKEKMKKKVETDMNHMKNMGTRQTNTEFGTRHEDSVSDMYHEKTGVKIQKDNARKTLEFMPGFQIVGRFDGFNEEGTLIEIKNRMKRLFGKVPEYENVQVQVYMKMAGVNHAQLVERYTDKIMIHEVGVDDGLMEEILSELRDICRSYF